jgi:hypothetical protein
MFLSGTMDLKNKLRNILNGGNLTLGVTDLGLLELSVK